MNGSQLAGAPLEPAEPTGQQPQMVRVNMPTVRPVVTYTMLGLCVLIYLGQMASEAVLGQDLLAALGAKVNEWIVQGELWRLFTPMFLHGSLTHIAFNMYALYSLGRGLENGYGHQRFLLLYLVGGVAGNVASFAFSPQPSLGSSTAIFGLLAAEAVYFYQNRELFGGRASQVLTQIGSIALINLVIGLSSPNIDNWGHLGGALGGAAFAWLAGPLLKVEGFYPEFKLVDQRDLRQAWLAATGLGFVMALIVLVLILFR